MTPTVVSTRRDMINVEVYDSSWIGRVRFVDAKQLSWYSRRKESFAKKKHEIAAVWSVWRSLLGVGGYLRL